MTDKHQSPAPPLAPEKNIPIPKPPVKPNPLD